MIAPPQWLVDVLVAVNLWDAVLAVGAVAAAVFGGRKFMRKVWPGLKAFAQAVLSTAQLIDSVKGLPAFIERTDARIAEIHHEVHFNNGSSVKDAAIRTENAVADLKATASRLEHGVAGLYGKVDELAEVDDRLWSEIENTGGGADDA